MEDRREDEAEADRRGVLRRKRRKADDREEHEQEEEMACGRQRLKLAKPVTPPKEPPPRPRSPRKNKEKTALDRMLEEDAFEVDSDQLKRASEEKLASLREDLQKKKAARLGSEPGAIWQTGLPLWLRP